MLALLHTSPVHIPVFDALRDAAHPGLPLRHLVAEELLDRARAEGPEAVAAGVRELIEGAVGAGAEAVMCTCSTIGGVAEACGPDLGVPVLRVDRPMAAAAVRAGRRIGVLAALHSTLEPTVRLIREEGPEADVEARVVDGAWAHFEAGDTAAYLRAVAGAADAWRDVDVLVLAQGSMAAAADLATTEVPLLSSPAPGLAAAAEVWLSATLRKPEVVKTRT